MQLLKCRNRAYYYYYYYYQLYLLISVEDNQLDHVYNSGTIKNFTTFEHKD